MGAGKTTFGMRFARDLGLQFIDTDLYIENRFHTTINNIFAERGEEAFRRMERNILEEVASFEDVVIATGGGMPCFGDNMQFMKDSGTCIYLKVDNATLASRLFEGKSKRPLLKDKNEKEIEEYIAATVARRAPFYEQADFSVDASRLDAVAQMKAVMAAL